MSRVFKNTGNLGKSRFPQLDHESKMWLLKTHSHTSERPGYEARKNAKKVLQGNADTIRRQTTRQKLPRTTSVAGGARRKSAIENQPPSKPSRISSAWRGGRDEERRTLKTLRADHEVAVGLSCGKANTKTPRSLVRLDPVFPRDSSGRSILFPSRSPRD